jgi:hypothetical protein
MANIITIPNVNEYTLKFINSNLILTRIKPVITKEELLETDLRHSKITFCKINDNILDVLTYRGLRNYIYERTNKQTIINNTILKIKEEKITDNGFKYIEKLHLSVQGANADRTLKEIINMIEINKFNLELKIKLFNNDEEITFII